MIKLDKDKTIPSASEDEVAALKKEKREPAEQPNEQPDEPTITDKPTS